MARRWAAAVSLTLAAIACAGASASTSGETVTVHVQRSPRVRGNLHIGFRAGGQLPAGGYYYGVIVLKPYRSFTREHPPPCATSSNMQRTDYGYPASDRTVQLALTPARSKTTHWCRGGVYAGAVYAVPQPPPCESRYPCRAEPYEPPSPCFEIAPGQKACGVVVLPRSYIYPDGLPRPLAKGTRIVGRFTVRFR